MTKIPFGPTESAEIDTRVATAEESTDVTTNTTAIAAINKLNKTKSAQLVYDFAVDGGATGTISMLDSDGVEFSLPDNSIITKSYYEVITTFTSSGDSATISLGHAQDVAGVFAATAISSGTTWDAAIPKAAIQTGAIATASVKTTGARPLQFIIAVEAVTAGKLHLMLEYYTTE